MLFQFSPWAVLLLGFAGLPAFLAEAKFSGEAFRNQRSRSAERRVQVYLEMLLTREDGVKEVKLLKIGRLFLQRYVDIFRQIYKEDRSLVLRRGFWGYMLGLVASAAVACGGDDDENGNVNVTAYGEEYVEEGIKAGDVDDGWEIKFDSFIVTFQDVKVGNKTFTGPKAVELAKKSDGKGFQVARLEDVDGGEQKNPQYTITGITVQGGASKNDVTKTFDWVFTDKVKYSDCDAKVDVKADDSASLQLTIHSDHLFGDSLVAENPKLLFGPLAAADADDDGVITINELKDAGIGAYDPGNQDIKNLWDFMRAQAENIGHVNGEGHCKSKKE